MIASMIGVGFLLGVHHALEADHVAAVAALSTRTASLRGLLRLAAGWGAGHTLSIVAVGTSAIVLGIALPDGSEPFLDRFIGAVLVVMGLDVLRRLLARHVHVHVHEHDDGSLHRHLHFHDAPAAALQARHEHHHPHAGAGRALAMGMLHGLAGSAALLLLALPRAGSAIEAIAYLLMFGIGSIAGMLLFSLVLSVPLGLAARASGTMNGLEGLLGLATIAVGVWIVAG